MDEKETLLNDAIERLGIGPQSRLAAKQIRELLAESPELSQFTFDRLLEKLAGNKGVWVIGVLMRELADTGALQTQENLAKAMERAKSPDYEVIAQSLLVADNIVKGNPGLPNAEMLRQAVELSFYRWGYVGTVALRLAERIELALFERGEKGPFISGIREELELKREAGHPGLPRKKEPDKPVAKSLPFVPKSSLMEGLPSDPEEFKRILIDRVNAAARERNKPRGKRRDKGKLPG